MTSICENYVGKQVAWNEYDNRCTGLVVGYVDYSEMPTFLRSDDSPDFDLLILDNEETELQYVSGAYKFEILEI